MQFANLGIRMGFPNRGKDETADGQRIIVAWGDSNARGNSTAVGSTPTLGTVKGWDQTNQTTYNVTNTDLLEPVAALAIGSQWPRFGITYNAISGKIPVICDVAIGGTRWNSGTAAVSWETSGTLWPDAETKVNDCLNFLGLDKPWGVYVNCGINDAAQDPAALTYAHLTYSINRINTNWNFPRIFINIIGKANETNYNNFSRIYQMNKFIKQLMQDYSNVEICGSMRDMVSWGGNIQVDDYHMNFTGNELHGTLVARQMLLPTSWLKYTRSVVGLHYDQISDTRKGYLNTLFAALGNSVWEYDEMHFYSDCAADDRNARIDAAFLTPVVLGSTPTISFDGITTNGSSTYISEGPPSLVYNKSSESDCIRGVFIGTNSSAAGGADRALIGIRELGTTGGIWLLNQRSTSQLGVLAAATSGTLSSSETKFANDSHYAMFRNGGDQGLVKNGSVVTSATVTQVAHGATALRGKTNGVYNNNTTLQQFINCVFEMDYTRKYTTMNLASEYAAFDAFLANWLQNIT